MELCPLSLGCASCAPVGLARLDCGDCRVGRAPVEEGLVIEVVGGEPGDELLEPHAERPPEACQPEREACAHDREGGIRDLDADPEVDDRRRCYGACEAEGHADERPEAELADDLLLVLSDVLLDGDLKGHSNLLVREPGSVQLSEVDGCGDDDRAAGDGGNRARDLAAALLLADCEAEADRAPDDEEAAQERHAARNEADDVV